MKALNSDFLKKVVAKRVFGLRRACYHMICSYGKSQPKQQMCDIARDTYHCHLNKYPPRFSDGQVQHKGDFPGDLKGTKGTSTRVEEAPILVT
jgi:hypothetical protein